jgi:hypothetical protein
MENTNLPITTKNLQTKLPSGFENLNAFYKIKEFDKVGYLVMPILTVLSELTKK